MFLFDVYYFYRFTGNIKLKGIKVIGGDNGSHPSKMRL